MSLTRWRVKVDRRVHLGYYPTPRAAAAAVARWWEGRHGPDWLCAYLRRCANTIVPVWSPRRRAFVVHCWGEGSCHILDGRRHLGWATRAEARAAGRRWAYRRYGMFTRLAMWRSDPPGKRDHSAADRRALAAERARLARKAKADRLAGGVLVRDAGGHGRGPRPAARPFPAPLR